MQTCYLLLGSNLGNKKSNLLTATAFINDQIAPVVKASSLYQTAPWGFSSEERFLNQALEIKAIVSPEELLIRLLETEKTFGRERIPGAGYQSRALDADILFYGNQIISTETLILPHPRLHLRRFALVPMNELAPDFLHPVLGKSMAQLLADCDDKLEVELLKSND